MNKRILILSLLALVPLLSITLNAQCKHFAKNICKAGLEPYQHDGMHNAALLVEGEEAELYKTLFSGRDYRLCVCGANNLSAVEFKVVDTRNDRVLYDNSEHDYDYRWDFRLEASQQLKIEVKVLVPDGSVEEPEEGCVAIMFGSLDD
jgi:hypothetical protein